MTSRAIGGTALASGRREAPPPGQPTGQEKPAARAARPRAASALRPTRFRTAWAVAVLTWLLGVVTIASALLPADRARLRLLTDLVPERASATATGVAAALGVLLLYLAGGLRRRKRRAWRVAVAVAALVAVSHLLKGLDVEEFAVSVGVLGALVWSRDEFVAEGDPVTRWLAVRRAAELLGLDVLLGLLLLTAYGERVVGDPSWSDRLAHVLLGLAGASGPVRLDGDRAQDVVASTLLALGVLTALVTAYFVLRPAQPVAALTEREEERLRSLLVREGHRDSLGYFALRRDKSAEWSPSGKAAVTYRVVNGVLLGSGDPIGDPEAWPGAIQATLELAARHAWVPAVVGCSELGATVWSRYGLSTYELGDEAVLEVADFSLAGRPMRGVRQAVSRVQRAGYATSVRRIRDVPADELATLTAAADAWRGSAVERGFSMALSRLGDPADGDCVLVTATRDGRWQGLLHFVPWGPDGLSLDLMRRDRSADNGLNELLIAAVLQAGAELGVKRVSLNFAVFRSALERGAQLGAGPVARRWRGVLVLASRWWQIDSLYRFNAKFRPVWQPRYLSFPSTRDLPRIALAALEAEAFLVRPRVLQRLLHRR